MRRAARVRAEPYIGWHDAALGAGCCLLIVFLFGAGTYLLSAAPTIPPGVFDPPGLIGQMGSVRDVLVAPFARWDSAWYLVIAHSGYGPGENYGTESASAFYPLYPLLMAIVGALGPGDLVAGVLISVVSLLVALRLIWLLTDLELADTYPGAARMAVLVTALFPTAFFLTAVYSESLFLALSAGAFWMARQGRWALAGTLGGLGAATRPSGVLILVGLALLYWDVHRHHVDRDVIWLALVPAGLGAYMGWLGLHGFDPLSPFTAEHAWLRNFAGPIAGLWEGFQAAVAGVRQLLSGQSTHVYWPAATPYGYTPMVAARDDVELFAFLLLALAALVGALRRLPLAYGAYATAALIAAVSYPLAAQPLSGLSRMVAVIFPLQMSIGCWLAVHRRWRVPVLVLFALGLAYYSGSFATWHWVA